MKSVRAMFLKFRGSNDKGWLWFRLRNCGTLGVVFVLFCESSYVFVVVDILVLYSFIWASKSILFIDVVTIPKNPAKNVCLPGSVLRKYCREKRNPKKLSIAYNIVNLSKM